MDKTLKVVGIIPGYLIIGISDQGIFEIFDDDGMMVTCEEPRITVKIAGGVHVIIGKGQHISFTSDGSISVMEVEEV